METFSRLGTLYANFADVCNRSEVSQRDYKPF